VAGYDLSKCAGRFDMLAAKGVWQTPMLERFRMAHQITLRAIGELHKRGNRFLAGCDGQVPGFCLRDGLEWFTKAGFSPLEALQTATINPTRFPGAGGLAGHGGGGEARRCGAAGWGSAGGFPEYSADCRRGCRGQTANAEDDRWHYRQSPALNPGKGSEAELGCQSHEAGW
jgi:hypothetical protein